MVERPQDTGCTSIEIDTNDEVLDEGVANGILSMLDWADLTVEYDNE